MAQPGASVLSDSPLAITVAVEKQLNDAESVEMEILFRLKLSGFRN